MMDFEVQLVILNYSSLKRDDELLGNKGFQKALKKAIAFLRGKEMDDYESSIYPMMVKDLRKIERA